MENQIFLKIFAELRDFIQDSVIKFGDSVQKLLNKFGDSVGFVYFCIG